MVVPTPTALPCTGGDQRLVRLAYGFDEAMGWTVDQIIAASLARKVRQIIARGKAVAVALEQNHADVSISPRLIERARQSVIHGAGECILLLWALQCQSHDALGDLGCDVLGHGTLLQAAARADVCSTTPSRKPVSRRRMICSASVMMRSISSFTVGISWIRPTTMPQLQAPASISPLTITFG